MTLIALLDVHLCHVAYTPLQRFRCQGHDLHVLLVAQLAGDRPEDTGAPRCAVGVDEHGSVLVELDVAAVASDGLPSSRARPRSGRLRPS